MSLWVLVVLRQQDACGAISGERAVLAVWNVALRGLLAKGSFGAAQNDLRALPSS